MSSKCRITLRINALGQKTRINRRAPKRPSERFGRCHGITGNRGPVPRWDRLRSPSSHSPMICTLTTRSRLRVWSKSAK
jgi:hypothetical protein